MRTLAYRLGGEHRAAEAVSQTISISRGGLTVKKQSRNDKTVQDVMVVNVVTIEPSASLAAAARAMEQGNVGMLPVLGDGRLQGIITDRDIVVRAIARAADPSTTRVVECLSANPITARPDWTTQQAMDTMAEAQVGRLPVVDEQNRLVGVVTLSSMAFRAPDKGEAFETAQEVSRRSARASAS
ncbi:MAG: CBS domain-containing protein [Candidatus Rokuibacteriota bacterium]